MDMDYDRGDLRAAERCLEIVRRAKDDVGNYRSYVEELEDVEHHIAHPMVGRAMSAIQDLVYEIGVDENEVKELFAEEEKALADYIAGNYSDTEICLVANYAREENGKTVEGLSFCVYRQNGQTTFRVSHEELSREVSKVIERVNVRQTDSWYLKNVGALLPVELSDGFRLGSWNVSEGLASGGNG